MVVKMLYNMSCWAMSRDTRANALKVQGYQAFARVEKVVIPA